MTTLRCAIYTRKSSEEGLEQSFNSLDAQREACEAYVKSQSHEGWRLIPTAYDDGGFSGGNLDRPALRRLLADMDAGKIDTVVVYKVDRLTRALTDFARIVDRLDAKGASFVSVTQAFNTTTSVGRLSLNVLLSFAQFEREVDHRGGPHDPRYRAPNEDIHLLALAVPASAKTLSDRIDASDGARARRYGGAEFLDQTRQAHGAQSLHRLQARQCSHSDEGARPLRVRLLQEIGAMNLDGSHADAKVVGYGLGYLALEHAAQDIVLARGEGR